MTTFELCGPLPSGTTVIEASAGTGKTYAIVGLAVRYLAEGHTALSQLMMVTFGRAATSELRDRTRRRLRECAHALSDPPAARGCSDELIAHLAGAPDSEVRARRQRLLRALSDFDAATIATTHAFCERMLDGIGLAGDYQPEAALLENTASLLAEVGDDEFAAHYCIGAAPALSVATARKIAQSAADVAQAGLEPREAATDSEAGARLRYAEAVRAEMVRRKRLTRRRDFNDLQVLLAEALADPVFGPVAARRVRDRYRMVLVDEFQDTDPLQWDILQRAFGGVVPLVLVGDPKQAIYAFRGADVHTYLSAVQVAGRPAELSTNWRSDADLIAGLQHLCGGAALGDERIAVGPVQAAHQGSRCPGGPPVRLRYLTRAAAGVAANKQPSVAVVRPRIAEDVATDIAATLAAGTVYHCPQAGPRPLAPSDFAVLVRTRDQGAMVRDALLRSGIPCVLTGGSSVFSTPAGLAWQQLLAALEQPRRATVLRVAALTPLVGHSAADLVDGGDALLAALGARMRRWAEVVADRGPAALFEMLSAETDLAQRLLGRRGGERSLTDLRHVAGLLDRAVHHEQLGITGLRRWLADRTGSDQPTGSDDRSRMLDRESAAARIITVHTAKGLEFPVVYVPYAWDHPQAKAPEALLLHEDGRRILDVGGTGGPRYRARLAAAQREDAGEDLRLFYVAATRAESRLVLHWVPTRNTAASALHRLLFGRPGGRAQPEEQPRQPRDDQLAALLGTWAAPAGPRIGVEAMPAQAVAAAWSPPAQAAPTLTVAQFGRRLSWAWQRSSFTALTTAAHDTDRGFLSESEDPSIADEPEGADVIPAAAATTSTVASLMNGLPSGTAFGNVVHDLLEHVDTAAADLDAEVHRCSAAACRRSLSPVDPATLATAVAAVLRTPTPHGALGAVAPWHRLTELGFELPLAGARDGGRTAASVRAIADLVESQLAQDDPLAAYPAMLRILPDTVLRGYLTGSLDAVLRVPGPRYVVVDYKTNRIFGGDLHAGQFDRPTMAAEMMRRHYPLQALLYSVALHRYLRWRQPGYRPATHLGGVMYLFVRAMVGPGTPAGCGVFDWRPAPALVVELSDLLAGT